MIKKAKGAMLGVIGKGASKKVDFLKSKLESLKNERKECVKLIEKQETAVQEAADRLKYLQTGLDTFNETLKVIDTEIERIGKHFESVKQIVKGKKPEPEKEEEAEEQEEPEREVKSTRGSNRRKS